MLHYNNIYNYITGLTNSRFVYAVGKPGNQPEPLPRMEEGVMSKKELEVQLAKYEKGEVVAAAGETDAEYRARVNEEIADTKRKLTEIEKQNTRQPVYGETTETIFGTLTGVAKKGKPRLREKPKFVPGTKDSSEEAVAQAPAEPATGRTTAEPVTLAKLDTILAKPETAEETSVEEEAMLAADEPETKTTEMAYLQLQKENPSDNMIADYVAISKRIYEELLIPGTKINDAVSDLQGSMTPRLSGEILEIGEVAKEIQARGEKVNVESIVEGLKAIATSADTKDKLQKQYDLLNS